MSMPFHKMPERSLVIMHLFFCIIANTERCLCKGLAQPVQLLRIVCGNVCNIIEQCVGLLRNGPGLFGNGCFFFVVPVQHLYQCIGPGEVHHRLAFCQCNKQVR